MTRLRVHVRVYSGRPDPVAELDEDASAGVLDALAPDRELVDDDLGLPPAWHLGYRGLLVEQLGDPDPRLPQVFEFGTDALQGPGLRHRVAEDLTDERLLALDGPVGRELSESLLELLPELLRAARAVSRTPRDSTPSSPTPCGGSAPSSDVNWWNDGAVGIDSHQLYNNCYNYATNQRTDTFAQPGRGSGFTLVAPIMTGERVRLYAWYDNLYDAPSGNNGCVPKGHLVGLAFAPEELDYHWWRKNQDGYWSHKPGSSPATSRDASGELIVDPRECDRGIYEQWVGFMAVLPGRPHLA